jgi:hypothetical protein
VAEVRRGGCTGVAYDDVLSELRQLRRSAAHRPIDLKDCPNLVWHAGRGSVDVTAQFLNALLDCRDLDVLAALASLGFDNYEENIENRMNAFIAMHEGDLTRRARRSADGTAKTIEASRTVCRWADKGFEKIASLVLEWSEEEGNDKALLGVFLFSEANDDFQLLLQGLTPPAARMTMPSVVANGAEIDLGSAMPADATSHHGRSMPPITVSLPRRADDSSIRLQIEWLGNVGANFEVQVHPSIKGRVVMLSVTDRRCEVFLGAESDFGAGFDISNQLPDSITSSK